MSAPLTFNLRVIEITKQNDGRSIAFIALNHFGTDSGILFECEYDSKQVGKWGVLPRQVRGNPFSYFGQFVGSLAMTGQAIDLNQENTKSIGQYNIDRLQAFSSAMAFLLNEFFQKDNRKDAYVEPQVLKKTLHDQTFILDPQVDKDTGQLGAILLPLEITQRDMTIAMAKLHWHFNKNVPRHFLYDDGKEGVISDVLVETGQNSKAANDS